MKEGLVEEAIPRDGTAVVRNFTTLGPKMVPRIDYERIFVLDLEGKPLGEYVLRDDCPLEFSDLERAIPLNGMRHLVTFYQGEYAFTPFRVETIWFVILSHGVPRVEDRGSIGTLLAAMRVHLPTSLAPSYTAREEDLRERQAEIEDREAIVIRREQRVSQLEAELKIAAKKLKAFEIEIRGREARINTLRDYAIEMQRAFRLARSKAESPREAEENPPGPGVSVHPPP
jgi:hypothetical protein